MPIIIENYSRITAELNKSKTSLVAVTKKKPFEDILALYELGQRDFGENYVQELVDKQPLMPKDCRWHFIGHLQTNKVKYIAPFVYLIQGVDSFNLLKEINKQAGKIDRKINCLLQVHIADEETKFGFSIEELNEVYASVHNFNNIIFKGMMGMASNTNDKNKIINEFNSLKQLFNDAPLARNPEWNILSMGMSGDYQLAITAGANMVRIGSLILNPRD